MDAAQGRPPGKAALPAMALSSSTPKPKRCWYPLGRGVLTPSLPTEKAFPSHPLCTPTRLSPSPGVLGVYQKNHSFYFIFYFSYKRPSYHHLSYKNQSPCL